MHDPLCVAFEIKRPWPRSIRGPRRYWPALVVVWHREPGGRDAGTVCTYRRMAWHVHHWKLQVPPLQKLRRRLLTRCTWCGGRDRKGDAVNVSRQWGGPRAPWWRGEQGLYHSDCSAVSSAHGACICEDPVLEHDTYGRCARCDRYRNHGRTPEQTERLRQLAQIPQKGRDMTHRRNRR